MRQRWLAAVLERIHELASQGRVHFTMKALRELAALEIGLDEEDARHVLAKGPPRNNCARSSGRLLNDPSHAGGGTKCDLVHLFLRGP
jgi:hypothetical protein